MGEQHEVAVETRENGPIGAIRLVTRADLGAVREIYNHAVVNTDATLDTEPKTGSDFETWFTEHQQRFRASVFELADDKMIAGYAALSPFARRAGYWPLAEISLYVAPDQQGRGVGGRLLSWLADEAAQRDFVTLLALVTSTNVGCITLLERASYHRSGRMTQAGHKLGRFVDVDIYQRFLGGPAAAEPGDELLHRSTC